MAALNGLTMARREKAPRPPRSDRGAMARHESMDWDDVRVFLAVARQG
jgi:hypothetical protein